ncbi:MAG: AAA family ATPase, partial [Nitrospinae bacterium]|nr:AAA family ATPase [Nitrospinota bacterium]
MKRQIISPAKITRPSIARVFPRKRLFRLIDNNRTGKAIWICGPPGAGKTTLIGSYIESRKLPCILYQVDEGDNDIPTFFHYLGIAAKEIDSRKRKPLPHLTPEYSLGINTFTRRYFEDFFSR